MGRIWDAYGTNQVRLGGHFEDILGIIWGYFGNILGIFWGYLGGIGHFNTLWDILGFCQVGIISETFKAIFHYNLFQFKEILDHPLFFKIF